MKRTSRILAKRVAVYIKKTPSVYAQAFPSGGSIGYAKPQFSKQTIGDAIMSGDSGADDIIGYSFLTVFANDNTIDSEELAFLKSIALRDGQLDADEREILGALFSRIDRASLAGDVASEIQQFKEQFQIP